MTDVTPNFLSILRNGGTPANSVGTQQIIDGDIVNADLATDIKIGSLSTLTTTSKTSVTGAINELDATKEDSFTGTLTSPITIPELELGDDLVVDSVMANWDDPNTLTSFDDTSMSGGDDDSLTQESTEKPVGATYSAKLTTGTGGVQHLIAQLLTNDDDWATFKTTVWAKNGTGSGFFAVLDRTAGADGDRIYNFTGVNAGTYTALTSAISSDQLQSLDSATGEVFSFDNLPQSDETSQIYIVFISPSGAGETCYIALPTTQLYERDSVTLFSNESNTDSSNLKDIDSIFAYETTGGTSFVHFEMDGGGLFKTDYPSFDFSDNGVRSKAISVIMAGAVPTPTELDTAFGDTADNLGDGFTATIQKDGSTETFLVGVYGDEWYYVALTKATA